MPKDNSIAIQVKGYEKPFLFPKGISQREMMEALSKIPPKEEISPSVPKTPQEQTPEWAGKHPNIYGAYGAAKETGITLGKSVSNIPKSALQFGKNLITPIIHPITTAKGIGNLFIGSIEKLVPGVQDKEKYADALGNYLVERYGSLENIKKTIEEDPVGVMADVSTFLTAGGAAATKVGQISKVGTLEKVGIATSKIGKATEPISVVSKVATPIVREGIEATKQVLGMTTGTGRGAVEQAVKGSKLFRESIKGKVTQEEMLDMTKDALQMVKDDRAKDYLPRLEKISNIKSTIDITPIKNKLALKLKDFKFKETKDGLVDFFDRKVPADTQEIYDLIKSLDKKAEYRTPIGLDTLKRTLDSFYSPSSDTRAFVASLRNEVRNTLVKNVPEYGTMVKNYEQTTDFLKEFDRALSTGKQVTADTAIRKLMSTQREGFEFRKLLLTKMEEKTGKDIQGMIAGISMQQITPKGLIGKLGAGTDIALALTMQSPQIAAALLLASPRTVGEFLYWIGKGKRGIDKTSHLLGVEVRNALQQTGRAKNIIEQQPESIPSDIQEYQESIKKQPSMVTAKQATPTGKIVDAEMPAEEALSSIKEDLNTIPKMQEDVENLKSLSEILNQYNIPKQYQNELKAFSKNLQKKKKLSAYEADKQAIEHLKKIYEQEKINIESQTGEQ